MSKAHGGRQLEGNYPELIMGGTTHDPRWIPNQRALETKGQKPKGTKACFPTLGTSSDFPSASAKRLCERTGMEDWSRRAAPDPVEAVEGPGRPVVAGCASEAPGRVPPAPVWVAPAPRPCLCVAPPHYWYLRASYRSSGR